MSRLTKMMPNIERKPHSYGKSLCTWILLTGDSTWHCTKRACSQCKMDSVYIHQAQLIKAYEEVKDEQATDLPDV